MKKSSVRKAKTITLNFSEKHKEYIKNTRDATYNIAEGAIRAGKTIDNIYAFYTHIKESPDSLHLATGATQTTAKTIIGDSNGLGLEYLFRGQCRWGKFKGNEALIINGPATNYKTKYVIFVGGGKADSNKKIKGFSIGGWIATEINLHHPDMIKEAFDRTAAAKKAKYFWDLNPDHPKHWIYTEHIDKYIRQNEEGTLPGGVNYQHFTIDDNLNIPEDNKLRIKAQYDPASIWYQKSILGKRVVAEGLIYNTFVNNLIKDRTIHEVEKIGHNTQKCIIGVDFGGNKSKHAFTCTIITWGFREVIAVKSEIMDAKGTTPEELFQNFYNFVISCIKITGGTVHAIYCDSAEQVLINGIRTYFRKKGLSIPVQNALKMPINERIQEMLVLISTGRFKFLKGHNEPLLEALGSAVWNPKNIIENERLDDGTTNIDTLDSFEYTIERDAAALIRR